MYSIYLLTLLETSGYEGVIESKAASNENGYPEFLERLTEKPDETIVSDIEAGLDRLAKDRVVLYTTGATVPHDLILNLNQQLQLL